MIFWLTVIALVLVGVILWYCQCHCQKKKDAWYDLPYDDRHTNREKAEKTLWWRINKNWDDSSPLFWIFWILFWALLVVIIIMTLVIGICYGSAHGEKAAMEQKYDALVYQLENDVYNDNGDDVVGKKELYDQISGWNQDVAIGRTYAKDFWWGIFWPDYHADLQYIELK